VGDPIAPFTLNTTVSIDASSGSFTNEVEISSDFADIVNDSTPDSLEAETSLVVVNDSGFAVRKQINRNDENVVVPVGAPFVFSLHYRNLGGSDFGLGQLIDVLPNLSDAGPSTIRTPFASMFTGSLSLAALTLNNAETVEYSIDPHTTIQHQPCHPDNWPAGDTRATNPLLMQLCSNGLLDANGATDPLGAGTGVTTWLPGPPPFDDTVTALRFTSSSAFPAGDPERIIDIAVQPTTGLEGDIYCNNFGAQIDSCTLDVISNDVCAELVAGSIGDTVFLDVNADGIEDAGDLPLAGVTMKLFDGAGNPIFQDPITGAVVPAGFPGAVPYVAVTDANGNYLFDNLPPGLTQTFDFDGAGDDMSVTSIGPVIDPVTGEILDVEDDLDQDFGYTIPLASLGDTVFFDDNSDGIQDPGEAPVPGVIVTLVCFGLDGVLGGTDDQVFTSVTDANGMYFFPNLFPGLNYQVTVTPPTGFDFSPQGQGGDPALDSSVDPLTGSTPIIVLGEGENNLTFDAGIIPAEVVDVVINIFDAAGELIASEAGWVHPGQATELNLQSPPFNLTADQYGLVEIVRTSEPSLSALAGTCFDDSQDNPLVVPWNGFLEQFNILTVQNTCPSAEAVELTLFDADGIERSSQVMEFAGNSQLDVSLNALEGYQVDQVGTVTLSYENSGCISGNLARFKLDASGSGGYDFDLNLPLVNMSTGKTYASYNTFQPSLNPADAANPVYNWLEVINLSGGDLGFTKNIYDVAGALVESEEVVIPSQARRDLQAGHENPGPSNVGIVELIPTDPEASYFARVMRYGSNPAVSGGFDFSSSSDAAVGETGCMYASVSSGADGENWLVVSNLGSEEAPVNVQMATGGLSALNFPAVISIPAKGQAHINTNGSLPAGGAGVATVCALNAQPLSVESNFYFRDAEAGNVSSAYTRRSDGGVCGDTSVASYNTFLGQNNWLRLTGIGGREIVGEVVRIEPETGLSSSSALQ
jgi:hypothetical protein